MPDEKEKSIKKDSPKFRFEGFKRTNLSKKDINKFNNLIDEEVKNIDNSLKQMDVLDEDYEQLVQRRAELLNQRLEKEPSKLLEHSLRYGLPIIASMVVTVSYLKNQDPSQDGKTWYQSLLNMLKFKN